MAISIYQVQNKANKLIDNTVNIRQKSCKSFTDFRASDVVLQNMIEDINSSKNKSIVIQRHFVRIDGTIISNKDPIYINLNSIEKEAFDILESGDDIYVNPATIETLRSIILDKITDKDFIQREGYVFTHETVAENLPSILKCKALLGGSFKGKNSNFISDMRKTGVQNPVFTRLTSKNTKRIARSGGVGSDRPVIISISPLAAIRRGLIVPDSRFMGCYNMDVGKFGKNEQDQITPKKLADLKKQRSNNEQHWQSGIDLENNAIGVAIKVKGSKEPKKLCLYTGNVQNDSLQNKDVFTANELIQYGDEKLKKAVKVAMKISPNVLGISMKRRLDDFHELFYREPLK